jgi:hypothetical protein
VEKQDIHWFNYTMKHLSVTSFRNALSSGVIAIACVNAFDSGFTAIAWPDRVIIKYWQIVLVTK